MINKVSLNLLAKPNPFVQQTTLQYTLAHDSPVTLNIIDAQGRQVTQLVNEQQLKGQYLVDFNAQDLPAGMYWARLQARQSVQIAKLMILKP